MTAALRGLDALVFTAGVGENAAHVRWLICEQLRCLGIHLDEEWNNRHATDIGSEGTLPVMVDPTDEEWEIACETARMIE